MQSTSRSTLFYSPSGDGGSPPSNMYYGASHIIFQRAEELRSRMTAAEELLWKHLHINEWKLKFRRQHPIAVYVADFYCHALKLVIELDGGVHDEVDVKKLDRSREADLKLLGLTVVRFRNEEVFKNIDEVLEAIKKTIDHLSNRSKPTEDKHSEKPKLFIVKVGGNIIDDVKKLDQFLNNFASVLSPLEGTGANNAILIHGGGKIATKIGEQLNIQPNYINGRRITDDATIDLVTMVYGGLVNKKIVAQLQSKGVNAIGLTGADANIIPATKRAVKEVDFGWVGDVESGQIEIGNLKVLLDAKLTPVFAPLTHDGLGHILNTNADTIASSLAVALSKDYDVRLIYCFEKKGVLENVEDENSVITFINKEKYRQLLNDNKLFEGILPKLENAFAAIDAGVHEVLIGDANDLIQNTTAATTGTLITA
jgi:acetylglutamate kinase